MPILSDIVQRGQFSVLDNKPKVVDEKDLLDFTDYDSYRTHIYDRTLDAVHKRFPISNDTYTLLATDLKYEGEPLASLDEQKQAILQGRTLARKVKGRLSLIDNATKQVIASSGRKTILGVPMLTQRGTYIRNGVEYSIPKQFRLMPNVYTRETDDGLIESQFNVKPGTGVNFRVYMEPETALFNIKMGGRKIPLYHVLKYMGVSDDSLKESWGKDIWEANRTQRVSPHMHNWINTLAIRGDRELREEIDKEAAFQSTPAVTANVPLQNRTRQAFLDYFGKMELTPAAVKKTLGREYTNVTPDTILAATSKIIKVHRGEAEEDDRDSLSYQSVHDIADFIEEKIQKDQDKVLANHLWKVTNKQGALDKLPAGFLNKHVDYVFTKAGLAQPIEEINPLDMLSQNTRVIRLGEGAIQNIESAPKESRNVQPSYLGFVDPIRAPECYAEDMEVFTKTGWKCWKDVTIEDEFACNINGVLEFHKAEKVVNYDYDGIMYGYNDKDSPSYLVTPEHRMYLADSTIALIKDIHGASFHVSAYDGSIMEIEGHKQFTTNYTGKVYCATVPGSLLYVRGNRFGFWCGNSLNIGLDMYFARGTRKGKDNLVYKQFLNPATKKQEWVNSVQAADSVIGFPEGLTTDDKYVPALYKSKGMYYVPREEVDYFLESGDDMFNQIADTVPLKSGIKGMRLLMGSKFSSQALPLIEREAPLVQTMGRSGKGVMEEYGKDMGAQFSKADGKVLAVYKDKIKLQYNDGTVGEVSLYDNYVSSDKEGADIYNEFPLARKTSLHNTPTVKAGMDIKKGDLLAYSNFTTDKGIAAPGKNLTVAYLNYRGKNFEDAVAISESAAKKLTSEMMYKNEFDIVDGVTSDPKKYQALFPTKYKKEQLDNISEDGMVKVGTVLNYGDPIFVGVKEKIPSLATLGRRTLSDQSVTWKHQSPGVVMYADKNKDGLIVYTKSFAPMEVGDKLAIPYGGKGVVAEIIPDDQAPTDRKGNPIDVLISPLSILSRTNSAQMIAAQLGKVAAKTGKPYILPGFMNEDLVEFAENELRKNNLSDVEDLYDPVEDRQLKDVFVGNTYAYKLHQTAESKGKARSTASYSSDETPSKGGADGSKHIGQMELEAFLSHGAFENLKDLKLIKAQKNDDFWRDLKLGKTPTIPNTPFVYGKFKSLLQSAGINLIEENDADHIFAMTNEQAKKATGTRKIENSKTFSANELKPIPGGLFDPELTGSLSGDNRPAYIELPEPMLNPVMEAPIRSILGITQKELDEIIATKGGDALKSRLSSIDLSRVKADAKEEIKSGSKSKRDAAIKRYRYVSAMMENDTKPADFMMDRVLVLPPKYRPISKQGDLTMVNDMNHMYKALMESVSDYKDSKELPKDLQDLSRMEVYNNYKAVVGIADPTQSKLLQKNIGGIFKQLFGSGSAKNSFVQRRVIGGDTDMSGLAVITPNPALKLNEVGLPENKAWELYEPFVVRHLVMNGVPATVAAKATENKDKMAYAALQEVIKQRPVLINRAPTLHKYSTMAMWPKLTKGKTLQIPSTIVKPYGADFDGDQQIGKVFFKIRVDSSYYGSIVSDIGDLCISNKYTEVTGMMHKLNVVVKDGERVFITDLEDFPHGDKLTTKTTDKGDIDWYDAAPEIQTIAYDEIGKQLVWADVLSWTEHKDRLVEIVTLSSGRQIFTDDDPRAIYGMSNDSLNMSRFTPTVAKENSVMIPVCNSLNKLDTLITEIHTTSPEINSRRLAMKPVLQLDADLGYYFGVMCGDGWVSGRDGSADIVYVAGLDQNVFNKIDSIIASMFIDERPKCTTHEFTKEANDDRYGDCNRIAYSSRYLAELTRSTLGHKAANKHLPVYFLTAPEEFRSGLLAGLIDTDGTVSISNGKAKPQLMCGFCSTSLRLANEVQLLARSLGIRSRVTRFTYREDRTGWQVGLSSIDMRKWAGKYMQCDYKRNKLNDKTVVVDDNSPAALRKELVPFPSVIFDKVTKKLSAVYTETKPLAALYSQCRKVSKNKLNCLSRLHAERLIALCDEDLNSDVDWIYWKEIVRNKDIGWEYIKEVEKTDIRETGYDLCVPGYETFMAIDGIILSNTMSYSVPISSAAVREAIEKMMPERNLKYVRDRSPTYTPSSEYLQGLYLGTRQPQAKSPVIFKTKQEALAAYRKGDLSIDDPIVIQEA